MEQTAQKPIDWLALSCRINEWQQHHRGWLSELKRCRSLDDIADYPAYYRLIKDQIPASGIAQRSAFLLPWLPHRADAKPIGEAFKNARISEMRLFQMMRSESPKDIELLRRLIQQAEPGVNWTKFGPLIYYWGKRSKRQIVEQYFLSEATKPAAEESTP